MSIIQDCFAEVISVATTPRFTFRVKGFDAGRILGELLDLHDSRLNWDDKWWEVEGIVDGPILREVLTKAFRIGEDTSGWAHPSRVELSIGSAIREPHPDDVLTGIDDRGSYRVHAYDLS